MVRVENTANPLTSRVSMRLKRVVIVVQSKARKIVIRNLIGHQTHYANAQMQRVVHVLLIINNGLGFFKLFPSFRQDPNSIYSN